MQRVNGSFDFAEIEEKLFDILVANDVAREQIFTMRDFFRHVKVRYIKDVDEHRQCFVRQAAGNLFGRAETVKIAKGSCFPIQTIDTAGTMLDSEPYVEVIWKQGFLLESVGNVEVLLDIDALT